MQSSVSANIITQLGYLQNYAGKGHFLTREPFGGTGALAPAAAKGPRCRPDGAPRVRGFARRAPASRGARSSLPHPLPIPPWWGLGTASAFSPLILFFLNFFPPFLPVSSLQADLALPAPARFVSHTLRRHHRDLPTGRSESALGGFFIIINYCCCFGGGVFLRFSLSAEPHGPGQAGDARLGVAAAQRSGADTAHRTAEPARTGGPGVGEEPGAEVLRVGGRAGAGCAAPGWSRRAAAGAPPFNLCRALPRR